MSLYNYSGTEKNRVQVVQLPVIWTKCHAINANKQFKHENHKLILIMYILYIRLRITYLLIQIPIRAVLQEAFVPVRSKQTYNIRLVERVYTGADTYCSIASFFYYIYRQFLS
jgi:hypothetical protein